MEQSEINHTLNYLPSRFKHVIVTDPPFIIQSYPLRQRQHQLQHPHPQIKSNQIKILTAVLFGSRTLYGTVPCVIPSLFFSNTAINSLKSL